MTVASTCFKWVDLLESQFDKSWIELDSLLLQLEEDDLPTDLVKVLIVGGAGVGKSSLCAQFVTSEYVNTYHQVGESFV